MERLEKRLIMAIGEKENDILNSLVKKTGVAKSKILRELILAIGDCDVNSLRVAIGDKSQIRLGQFRYIKNKNNFTFVEKDEVKMFTDKNNAFSVYSSDGPLAELFKIERGGSNV